MSPRRPRGLLPEITNSDGIPRVAQPPLPNGKAKASRMTMPRRRMMLSVAPLIPFIVLGKAEAETTDLALMCDLTLGPVLSALGRAFQAETGVRIHVFPTPPGLILPQLTRDVQNDIVLTQIASLDLGASQGLLSTESRSREWSDPLVIAEKSDAAGDPDTGMFAISELPSASGIDGTLISERLNLPPTRVVSAIDTSEVAELLVSRKARSGLLFLTDVRANPDLRVVRVIATSQPMIFAAAVTKLSRRPNPGAFLRFLGTPRAMEMLSAAGLGAWT